MVWKLGVRCGGSAGLEGVAFAFGLVGVVDGSAHCGEGLVFEAYGVAFAEGHGEWVAARVGDAGGE